MVYEQEIRQFQTVQLMHKRLSGVANDYLYTRIRDKTENMDEAFSTVERRFSSKNITLRH